MKVELLFQPGFVKFKTVFLIALRYIGLQVFNQEPGERKEFGKTPLRRNRISDMLQQSTVNRLTEIIPPVCAYRIPRSERANGRSEIHREVGK
ncbi:hypothetical protein ABH897_002995 [Paenibacillus sp. RC73]|uniref:hypothetical protein n=1 Tax=Paenibacillus sp. RC73 TaxID=3156250 RepID=UPI003836118F